MHPVYTNVSFVNTSVRRISFKNGKLTSALYFFNWKVLDSSEIDIKTNMKIFKFRSSITEAFYISLLKVVKSVKDQAWSFITTVNKDI